ncbi:hypothetical protein, partial [Clostridium sp.]|uniref:hypothetical protein n=1 Tax=Clostridium sp. TaxID=1506 RepID=UPI002847D58F
MNELLKRWICDLKCEDMKDYLDVGAKYQEFIDSIEIKFVFDQMKFIETMKESEDDNKSSSELESLSSSAEKEACSCDDSDCSCDDSDIGSVANPADEFTSDD